MKDKKKIIIGSIILVVILAVVAFIASLSFAAPLENDVRVAENSELTYYIDVTYDGKDGEAVASSDSATAQVYSDYIYVEDKIPDGLIFNGFVETENGTIGAIKRSDGSYCSGYVEGGVAGLSYDEDTRTVSFRVKNLQAGCQLTVGIKTMTPSLGDQVRMDFYNTAYGREGSLTVKSNTVHVFMGRESVATYNVSYQYEGTVPDGAPEAPSSSVYAAGTTVGVSAPVEVEGYKFSGWSTSTPGVIVTDGSFVMPASEVVFVGSFEEDDTPTHEVSYSIEGTAPEGYIAPKTKSYPVGSDVKLDSLKVGDVINGYRFLGWTTTDVSLPEGQEGEDIIFTMPEKAVQLVGEFERISYTVSYQFQGSVLPPNADSLLPSSEEYYPGDEVTTAPFPDEPDGYKFLGWYQADSFTMPEEDVIIYGEWALQTGTFVPMISKEIVNPQESYQSGDVVTFNITVTNTADFTITDVMLEEMTEGCQFIAGNGYTVMNDQYVTIESIAAHQSVTVSAQYTAGDDVVKNVTNVVELVGALADNNYSLDTSQTYRAEVDFTVANISLEITKINTGDEVLTGAEFTMYQDRNLQQVVAKGLTFEGLAPNTTYYLEETKAPTGYQLLGTVLEINVDGNGGITISGYEVSSDSGVNRVSIINQKINILPNTGGIGIVPYIVVGLLLVIGGVVCCIKMIRKRGDGDEKRNS